MSKVKIWIRVLGFPSAVPVHMDTSQDIADLMRAIWTEGLIDRAISKPTISWEVRLGPNTEPLSTQLELHRLMKDYANKLEVNTHGNPVLYVEVPQKDVVVANEEDRATKARRVLLEELKNIGEDFNAKAFQTMILSNPASYTHPGILMALYHQAKNAPRPSSIAAVKAQHQDNLWIADGTVVKGNVKVRRGILDQTPVIVKFGRDHVEDGPGGDVEREFNKWKEACQGNDCFLPLLKTLQVQKGTSAPMQRALVMPECVTTAHEMIPFPEGRLSKLREDVVKGLQHLHQNGWCFCDLKPDNIFLTPNGNWILGDYGGLTKSGEVASEITSEFVPHDWPYPPHANTPLASPELDLAMLETTLMVLAKGMASLKSVTVQRNYRVGGGYKEIRGTTTHWFGCKDVTQQPPPKQP